MLEKIYSAEKKETTLKAISDLCLHCDDHTDDCAIVKAEQAVESLPTKG